MPEPKILTLHRCPHCHKEFAAETRKRFCCKTCQQRFNAKLERDRAGVIGTYHYAGYEVKYNTCVEDYQDFETLTLSALDVRDMLRFGHFPPGLILRNHKDKFQVVGRYYSIQKLSVWTEAK